MTQRCPSGFDQARLSGYLDSALTQQEDQRVRIHLENCATCRKAYDELAALREVTMSTQFVEPTEQELDERPKGGLSLGLRSLGWLIAGLWLAIAGGYALWQAWQGTPGAFERFLAFGGAGGALLLFLSVLVDRLVAARRDPYRGVNR
ncbi:MAG: zf-HC2 domain-containing protein [Acidobacteria bacterium]|nr:zf-HC2 domain-containing protein [Acidobacteriota bacterium]MCB9378134.1 zf-HC2 domain-containing protein [Holophagales bacterium]